MKLRTRAIAIAAAAGLAAAPMMTGTAQAAPGTTSLGDVLLADTVEGAPSFDKNGGDFDILTAAVLGVLDNDPDSVVGVLLDGDVTLTAFIPTDKGFERTAGALGITAKNEKALTNKLVAALGGRCKHGVALTRRAQTGQIQPEQFDRRHGARPGKNLRVQRNPVRPRRPDAIPPLSHRVQRFCGIATLVGQDTAKQPVRRGQHHRLDPVARHRQPQLVQRLHDVEHGALILAGDIARTAAHIAGRGLARGAKQRHADALELVVICRRGELNSKAPLLRLSTHRRKQGN